MPRLVSSATAEEAPGGRTVRTARTATVLAAGEISGKLATLALVVVSARILGAENFGVFALALATGLLVAEIPQWGFDTIVIRRGAADRAQVRALVSETLAIRMTVSVLVLVATGTWVFLARSGQSDRITILAVVAACLLDTFGNAFRSGCVALERQNGVAVALVAQRMCTALLVVGALLCGAGLGGIGPCYLVGSGLGLIAIIAVARRAGVRPGASGVTARGVLRTARESVANGVNGVVSMAMFRLDAVLLAVIAGDVAVGVYAAAYRLLETVLFVSWTVARALFPIMASAQQELWRVRRAMQGGLTLLTLVYLPYAALLWTRGRDILDVLYGSDFVAGATVPLWWLAPAPLAFGVAYVASQTLYARHADLRTLGGSVLGLVVNIALNLALITAMHAAGAAIATTIAYGVEAVYQLVVAHRVVGGSLRLRPLLAPMLASAVLAGLLLIPLPLAAALALGTIGFLLSWTVVVRRFDPEQLAVVRSALLRRPS